MTSRSEDRRNSSVRYGSAVPCKNVRTASLYLILFRAFSQCSWQRSGEIASYSARHGRISIPGFADRVSKEAIIVRVGLCMLFAYVLLFRKEEIFNEASKALKRQPHAVDTGSSDGASDAKKLKTSVDVDMPSFVDMMAYIHQKVRIYLHLFSPITLFNFSMAV